ncbi:unnamed protein product [Caenorhabditis brenneri]
MDSQPMKYDSLRVVLHYFEANKRIQLAARIPSIRKCEKTIPLKIDYLSFKEDSFTINKIKYEVSIHRHYHATQTKAYLKFYGDCKLDMDKYGHEDINTWKYLEPGDIVMNPPQLQEPERHEIEMIGVQEELLARLEPEFVILSQANQKYLQENGFQNIDELRKCMYSPETNFEKARRLSDYFFREASRFLFIEAVIEQTKYRLQCLYCLRDDTPPPFKTFLQQKLYKNYESPCTSEIQHGELVEYNRKLPDAIRSILKTVFGGRKCSVLVDTFDVNHYYNIRAPTDLKLKVQKLNIRGGSRTVCNPLQPIIDSSSLPLKEVFVENFDAFTPDFHHDMVKKADKLIVGKHEHGIVWLPILLSLENKIVEMKGIGTSLAALENYIELIRSWVDKGKPVGTTFIFDLYDEEVAENVLVQAAEQHRGAVKGEGCIAIPMKNRNMLQLSYEDNEEFTLVLKVLPTNTDAAEQLSNLHIG